MKVETKIQMEKRLKNEARQRIKDRINEKMELQIQHFKNKNNTKNYNTTNTTHLIHKNMITSNIMYSNTIIPTLLQDLSIILK